MDDKELQKHYERIMRELENERLMTFEEMVKLTKIPPEVLKRTIPVLARGLCSYQKHKAELVDEDLDEHWTVQDMQDIVDFEEKRELAMQKCQKVKKDVKHTENKENLDLEDKEREEEKDEDLGEVFAEFGENLNIDDNPHFEQDNETVSFEDLVKLTGTHPFYLERCVCHLAILAETQK